MVTRAGAALALVAVAGCGDPAAEVAPVIDLPAAGSEADPMLTIDAVELSVARAGDEAPLLSASFARGEPLVLAGVPAEDDLVIHLVGRAGDVDVAYGRTCRFALSLDEPAPAPHLWFTRIVRWADAAPPVVPDRRGGAAWTTADDTLAVALGEAADGPVSTVEVFDPSGATWRGTAEVLPRRGGTLAPLGDGRAVIVGGRDPGGAAMRAVEIVDPLAAVDGVDTIDDPRLGLDGTAAVAVGDGEVVVIGGRDDAGPVAAAWRIRVGDDGQVEPPRQLVSTLATPRAGHTLTRLSDDLGAPVVVIGGVDAAGEPVATAELYRPLGQAFSPGFAPPMVVARSRHVAARMPDGSVLVAGGVDATGAPVTTLERFTIDGGFVVAGELPAGAGLVDAALTELPDGRVLLSGGRTDEGAAPVELAYVIRLDPLDGSVDVIETDDLDAARAEHVAAVLCDGTVLAVGGDGASTADRYQPPPAGRR